MIVIVPENSIYIQERLGQYSRTFKAGVYFQLPIIERIAYRFSQNEQIEIFKDIICSTKDNEKVMIDAIFIYQIKDAFKAAYGTDSFLKSIRIEIESYLLAEIQNYYADEIISKRYGINQIIVKNLSMSCENFGLKIVRFEIQQMKRDVKII